MTFASTPGCWPRACLAAMALACAAVAPSFAKPAPLRAVPASEPCRWDRPGHDPYMGSVVDAVDRYGDIPADVRARLKARIAKRDYDDVVSIRRDRIDGRATYSPLIRDMHFGKDRVCRSVTRDGWSDAMHERGLVYCEERECILVPTVCRNVSRILRATVGDEGVDEPPGVTPGPPLAAAAPAPVPFPAPPVGPPGGEPSFSSSSGPLDAPGPGPGEPPWGEGGPGGPGGPGAPPIGSPPGSPPGIVPPVEVPPLVEPPLVVPPPIPEPGTWAMVAAGLAALGWAQRRRRQRDRR